MNSWALKSYLSGGLSPLDHRALAKKDVVLNWLADQIDPGKESVVHTLDDALLEAEENWDYARRATGFVAPLRVSKRAKRKAALLDEVPVEHRMSSRGVAQYAKALQESGEEESGGEVKRRK